MQANLRQNFKLSLQAGESAIRIDTDEIDDAVKTITEVTKRMKWDLRMYDETVGTRVLFSNAEKAKKKTKASNEPRDIMEMMGDAGGAPNMYAALRQFWEEPAELDTGNSGDIIPVVYILKNFHLAFNTNRGQMSSLIQHIVGDKIVEQPKFDSMVDAYDSHGVPHNNSTGKFIIALMPPEQKLPAEVSPLFRHLIHELPDEKELGEILDGVIGVGPKTGDGDSDEDNSDAITEDDRKKTCKFALGLTRLQAEGVFGACLVKFRKIVPAYVWTEKSAILNKEGLVELHNGKETFDDVAGLEGAKAVIKQLLTTDEYDDADPDVRAKGALFCGPPGVGKSLLAKAAGNEMGLPTLMVNPSNWKAGIVGSSEANTRRGLQIIKAHAPCIAVVDEVEKVMPSSKGHRGDTGVSASMEGSFLTAMNDMTEPVFWVFTANDVQAMHEAFFRAERVDAAFYVKLPGPMQRAALWRLYVKKFFPEKITVAKQEIDFPGHLSLDFNEVLNTLKGTKKRQPEKWAARLCAAIMCLPPEEREAAIAAVAEADLPVAEKLMLVDDDGWSPAEIRSCCRLSRRLKEPLYVTQKRIRPVKVSAKLAIKQLERWAKEAALDAETGEVYVPPQEGVDPKTNQPRASTEKRTVRKTRRAVDIDDEE